MNDDLPSNPAGFSVRHMLWEIKDYASRKPATAVAAAFGVGLLINLLPARAVMGAVTIVGATLMRPVLLSLGATKAMELCCQKNSTPIHS